MNDKFQNSIVDSEKLLNFFQPNQDDEVISATKRMQTFKAFLVNSDRFRLPSLVDNVKAFVNYFFADGIKVGWNKPSKGGEIDKLYIASNDLMMDVLKSVFDGKACQLALNNLHANLHMKGNIIFSFNFIIDYRKRNSSV